MEEIQISKYAQEYGFLPNKKAVNGFVPKFKKDDRELLFILNKSFTPAKLAAFIRAYPSEKYQLFGVLTTDSPRMAPFDWLFFSEMKFILLDFSNGQLKKGVIKDEQELKIDYIDYSL